jgi:hypothetical protein
MATHDRVIPYHLSRSKRGVTQHPRARKAANPCIRDPSIPTRGVVPTLIVMTEKRRVENAPTSDRSIFTAFSSNGWGDSADGDAKPQDPLKA